MLSRIILLAITLLMYGCASVPLSYTHITPKPKNTIRFATYNVYWQNSSKNKHNPESITALIQKMNPDIIVLQETYCFSAMHLEKMFRKKYPYRLFEQGKNNTTPSIHEDGLGLLSKYPVVKNIYFPPSYGWFPGWLYVLKTPKGYIQVLNVHLNPCLVCDNNIGIFAEGLWLTPYYRLKEIQYYYKYLDPTLPTIIAGDFNENDEGKAAYFLREQQGYNDILLHIPRSIKTWHSQYLCFHFTGRYDRIYTHGNINPVNCQVLQKGYSDHFPVIMDFTGACQKHRRYNAKKSVS